MMKKYNTLCYCYVCVQMYFHSQHLLSLHQEGNLRLIFLWAELFNIRFLMLVI